MLHEKDLYDDHFLLDGIRKGDQYIMFFSVMFKFLMKVVLNIMEMLCCSGIREEEEGPSTGKNDQKKNKME